MSDNLDPVRAALDNAQDIDVPAASLPPGAPPPQDPGPQDDPPPPEATAAHYPCNDIGNGQRFGLYHGADTMRVPRVGWFVWTGTHWVKDDDELRIRGLAQTVSARMEGEIQHLNLPPAQQRLVDQMEDLKNRFDVVNDIATKDRSPEQRKEYTETRALLDEISDVRAKLRDRRQKHGTFAKSTGNSAKIDAMMKEGGIALAHQLDDLDAEPHAVNCISGTLRFEMISDEDGRPIDAIAIQHPHDRADRITKCMPCAYDSTAKAPLFEAFLKRIQPKASMRQFIQRWFGLSMSGIPVQKLAFFYGHGANGKSVLVDLMCQILADYSATAPIEALTGQSRRGGSDATPELIPLIGARAVRASEPEQGERFKEGMIKSLTSGEPIAARALHSDFVFIKPFFKLTISGNHKPEIRGTDDGIWRRVLLVPFDVQIPEEERDQDLGEKLWAERDGIFNWMVDGLEQVLCGGLRVPPEILAATDDYRKDSDPTAAFLTGSTVVTADPSDFILSKDLVAAFRYWLEEEGQTPWGERQCALRLKEKADRWPHPETQARFTPHRKKSSGYAGIRFKDIFRRDFEAFQDSGGKRRTADISEQGDF